MSTDRPPADSDPLRDPRFEAGWQALSRENPPPALDARILAAAHRAVGAAPQRADVREATRPERWWWPLAAAASIGAVAFGILQVIGPDRAEVTLTERAVVSDAPMELSRPAAPTPAAPTAPPPAAPGAALPAETAPASAPVAAPPGSRRRDTGVDTAAPAPPRPKAAPLPAPVAPPMPAAVPEPAPPASPAPARDAAAAREAVGASAVGGVAPAVPRATAPTVAPAAPNAVSPAPAAGALRAEAQRKATAPLPVDEWLARIRKLRAEGNADELAREIAAFRAAYPDEERRLQEELARPLPK
jgi:hypothetical protein